MVPDTHTAGFPRRGNLWSELADGAEQEWDVIVVGGGITGAGTLREAARRGYRCLLVEQRDFAWGTSSRSSKLVHGGLRYLASGQFSLTWHSLRERERLLREAPGLIERAAFHFPIYRGRFPPKLAAHLLFWLYDRMAGVSDHRWMGREQLGQLYPDLAPREIRGSFRYTDAITEDARLTLRVLHESVRDGAAVLNYARATDLLRDGDHVTGLRIRDQIGKRALELRAHVIVNATGPWADRLRAEVVDERRIQPQRGSHIVLPAEKYPASTAIFLQHPEDGRRVFVYPWQGRTVIGTTDIRHDADVDTAASITPGELTYLLTAGALLFTSSPPGRRDVLSTWSGVRPIVLSGKRGKPSELSRDHHVWVDEGLVTCSGGKLTTFRHMAADVMSRVESALPATQAERDGRVFRETGMEPESLLPENPRFAARLLGHYGGAAADILDNADPGEIEPLAGTPYCLAEIRWSLRHEAVIHLDDLMLRRTRLGLLLKRGAGELLDEIRPLFVQVQGWDDRRWERECERYLRIVARHYTLPPEA